jgi:hypothetical protein
MSHPSCYHTGYALSCAEYDQLLMLAAGRCMICCKPTTPLIDHDHRLGWWAVRGLVCHACNQHLKYVDAGLRQPTEAMANYLANAWHLRQPSSTAKKKRMKPRTRCARCGYEVSARADGKPSAHWSRLPSEPRTICPGM